MLVERHHKDVVKFCQTMRASHASGGGTSTPAPNIGAEDRTFAQAVTEGVIVAEKFAFSQESLTQAERAELFKLEKELSATPEGTAAALDLLRAIQAHDKEAARKAFSDLCAPCQAGLTLLGLPDRALRGTLSDAVRIGALYFGGKSQSSQGASAGNAPQIAGESRRELILTTPAGGGGEVFDEVLAAESNRLELPRPREVVAAECTEIMKEILTVLLNRLEEVAGKPALSEIQQLCRLDRGRADS